MFRRIKELCQCIAVMNDDGMDRLITLAKDITGHKKFRKGDNELTPAQFTRQVNQVLSMVERGYIKENEQCRNIQ